MLIPVIRVHLIPLNNPKTTLPKHHPKLHFQILPFLLILLIRNHNLHLRILLLIMLDGQHQQSNVLFIVGQLTADEGVDVGEALKVLGVRPG